MQKRWVIMQSGEVVGRVFTKDGRDVAFTYVITVFRDSPVSLVPYAEATKQQIAEAKRGTLVRDEIYRRASGYAG